MSIQILIVHMQMSTDLHIQILIVQMQINAHNARRANRYRRDGHKYEIGVEVAPEHAAREVVDVEDFDVRQADFACRCS